MERSLSAHVIAVISKNVTASQAETILTMLTHNVTNGRIGNNVTITSTSLYLLHLPNDILSAIPTSVMNSGMGEGPDYYSLGSIIGDIANMVFDFLVWVATGGVLLLLAHLVKEGLKAISNLVSTAITAVEAAVDRIVDAFCAMVDWIVCFIRYSLNELLSEKKQEISDSCEQCIYNLNDQVFDAAQDYSANQSDQGKVNSISNSIFNLNIFQCLLVASIIIFAITTAVYWLVPGNFIGSILIGEIINFLVATPLVTAFYFVIDNWGDWVWEMLGDGQTIFWEGVISVVSQLIIAITTYFTNSLFEKDIFALAISIFSVILAVVATQISDLSTGLVIGFTGLAISIASYMVMGMIPSSALSNPFWKAIIKISAIASIAIAGLSVTSIIAKNVND